MAFTEGLADTDRGGASWSHGEEAGRMGGVSQATELSQLLSTTAVLFRGLAARRLDGDRLSRLSDAAKRLVRALADIAEGQTKEPAELPYRQLVPLRVWQMTIEETDLADLATSIPSLVDDALIGKVDASRLSESASRLEIASERLKGHATRVLRGELR